MRLTKLVLYSVIQRLTLAKGNKIGCTAMAAQHLNTSRSCESRLQANVVMLPSAYSEQFERFCELNKGTCPLLYRSKPGDTKAASLAGNADIRYVKKIPKTSVDLYRAMYSIRQACCTARNNLRYFIHGMVFFLAVSMDFFLPTSKSVI